MRRLEAVLADLLARTGAEAARVVDAPTAAVLAEVVSTATRAQVDAAQVDTAQVDADTSDVLAGLVRLAAAAAQVAAADGGLDDLVVGGRRAVHVLRAIPGAAYLYLRLDPARDGLPGARRWLADPTLHQAILEVLRPAVQRSTTPRSAATVPTPAVVPSQRPAPTPRPPELPAITVLQPDPPRSMGALAVLALGPQHRERSAGDLPLPRRATAAQSVPEVLDRAWSRDADTLRRILAGLHRLS